MRIPDLDRFRSLFEAHGVDVQLAAFAGSAARGWVPSGSWGADADLFIAFVNEMQERLPKATVWTVDLHRNFAALEWVLAAAAGGANANQLAQESTYGHAVLELDIDGTTYVARGGQGFGVRFSTNPACQKVADFLSGIAPAKVLQYVDIGEMQDLYKVRPDDDHQELGELLAKYLSDLTVFYQSVAESGHGVVVCRD